MRTVDLIMKTRRGEPLSKDEISFLVNGFTNGEIPDYQMSAWMMAVCLKGMAAEQIADLTMAMKNSGDSLDLSDIKGIKIDKHSTGGVADSASLIAAPLVAACGGNAIMLSGRGLGHTGGTLDKLESIPSLSTTLDMEHFKKIASDIGLCIAGQTDSFVPADKLMYALRDVTGTVESIPLIASSIMSKKLAMGSDAIILDVKTGSGAFMRDIEDAEKLAGTMVDIGKRAGRRTSAIITDMNQPLGSAIGNALEIIEVYDALSNRLCAENRLLTLSLTIANKALTLSGLANNSSEAQAKLMLALKSGEGLKKLQLMLSALGGKDEFIVNPRKMVDHVSRKIDIYPVKSGYVSRMQTDRIGIAAQLLGAGRARRGDSIDYSAGLVMHISLGSKITTADSLATMYVNDDSRLDEAKRILLDAIKIDDYEPVKVPLIYKEVN
jgi:pyrimidine-nucleoside phosphorylase